ncbi:Zinc ion binding protein [Phytophthora cinnamomi]|uniref:Zinc ion binding protein n=1 Tax=Phytophthora cinnamomi TaxID=4785 RepID=UPI00355A07C3|nr:Zinc ion binding protein [Phytophthora cinnamomi]
MEIIRSLSSMDSRAAIEAALAEAMDSLRLCRSDNVGIRFLMPTLMLLLGQYQEAYDFIKWHTKIYQESNYDYGNMELPYLDLHGADMPEDAMPVACGDVFYTSSLVSIKMVLVKAVQDAIAAHELAARASLPAVVTDALGHSWHQMGIRLADLKELHRKLTRQMMELFSLAHTQNKHFWDAMLDPFPLIMAPEPPYYSDGDANKVKMWVEQNAMLWHDHLDFIREHLGKLN